MKQGFSPNCARRFSARVAPWKATYVATQIYRGKTDFTLAGSGHIAGIVNPPAAKKYGYWTNDENPPAPDDWFAGAAQHEGSWWPHWKKWIAKQSGKKVPAAWLSTVCM